MSITGHSGRVLERGDERLLSEKDSIRNDSVLLFRAKLFHNSCALGKNTHIHVYHRMAKGFFPIGTEVSCKYEAKWRTSTRTKTGRQRTYVQCAYSTNMFKNTTKELLLHKEHNKGVLAHRRWKRREDPFSVFQFFFMLKV